MDKTVVVGLALGVLSINATTALAAEEYTAVTPAALKWQDAPSIGPGAKMAVVHGDPKAEGPFVMRLKVPAKTKIAVHTHPADENVTVLAGTLHFAAGDKFDNKKTKAFGPGSYFSIGKGKPMYAYTGDKETIVQLHGQGPWGITYNNPADDPAKQAKKQ